METTNAPKKTIVPHHCTVTQTSGRQDLVFVESDADAEGRDPDDREGDDIREEVDRQRPTGPSTENHSRNITGSGSFAVVVSDRRIDLSGMSFLML